MTTDGQTRLARRRCIIAGVDEAGFGPLLGPLVIGATAWQVPDGDTGEGSQSRHDAIGGADLWDRLRGGVTRTPSKRGGRFARLAINDSKKIYSTQKGLGDLERGVLGTLQVQSGFAKTQAGAAKTQAEKGTRNDSGRNGSAPSFGRFLDRVAPGWAEQAAEHPWYNGCGDVLLPVASDPGDLATRANGLRVAMDRGGVRFLGAGLELVLEARYNRLSATIGNKSRMLFCCTARVIQRLFDRFGQEKLTVVCDKQGGRDSYRGLLQEHWPDLKLTVIVESAERSGYQLAEASGLGRAMDLWFTPGADLKYLPASLASMYCKYTRELFMRTLNRFWREQVGADLRATAGYYSDGQRFVAQISESARRLGLSPERFIRER